MDTKPNHRVSLTELVEKLDAADMKQILAFVAGYEAGKIDQTLKSAPNQESTHTHQ